MELSTWVQHPGTEPTKPSKGAGVPETMEEKKTKQNRGGLGLDCKSMKPSSQLLCMLSGSKDDFPGAPSERA